MGTKHVQGTCVTPRGVACEPGPNKLVNLAPTARKTKQSYAIVIEENDNDNSFDTFVMISVCISLQFPYTKRENNRPQLLLH